MNSINACVDINSSCFPSYFLSPFIPPTSFFFSPSFQLFVNNYYHKPSLLLQEHHLTNMKPALAMTTLASASRIQRSMLIRNTATILNLHRQNQRNQAIFDAHTPLRAFSAHPSLLNQQQKDSELPKFSFEGLGMSKNSRIFVIVVLSIFGTIETWVWCKGIYRWWYGPSEEEKKRAEASHK